MFRYVVRRLLISIPVLLGITMITFLAYSMAPGDPVLALIEPGVDPQYVEVRKEALGLNQPIYVRYLAWLNEVAHGNLGYSYRNGLPVVQRIAEALPATLQLNLAATVL
ncbi:MAG TPA: ABC transporter permease, partial [Caldilineaceae bacterium]|nr:ABC transporter permease [Caldilineaceae bacterium]